MGNSPIEVFLRMVVALLLAAPIGFERERSGHPAGLRTHLLIGMSSALLMLVSTQLVQHQDYVNNGLVRIDAARIAAGAVQGVGLLCGGAIIRMGANVRGLTTAASMWSVSAMGLCAGAGMFVTAGATCAIVLAILVGLARVEGRLWQLFHRRIVVVLKATDLDEETASRRLVAEALRGEGGHVLAEDYERDFVAGTVSIAMMVRFSGEPALVRAVRALESVTGIHRISVQKSS